jgi:hypothetical protein
MAIACHPIPSWEGLAVVVKENLTEISVVIIPNHAPATNQIKELARSQPRHYRDVVPELCPIKAKVLAGMT